MASLNIVFPDFEPELQKEIIEVGILKSYPAGTELMRTGQYIRSTLLLLDGLVKIYREDDEGNEYFMYYLQPGQGCAITMICADQQEASKIKATAVTETEMIALPVQQMSEWMGKYKSWYRFVIETYRSRFDELLKTIDDIAFRNMDERLEFYLRRSMNTLGTNKIEISHQEIANELNSSREVISRLLKKMEQLGKVALHRNVIEILDLEVVK